MLCEYCRNVCVYCSNVVSTAFIARVVAEYRTLPDASTRRSQLLAGRLGGAGASHSLDRDRQRGLAANATLKRHGSTASACSSTRSLQRDTSPGLRKPLMLRLYHLAGAPSLAASWTVLSHTPFLLVFLIRFLGHSPSQNVSLSTC